MRKIQTKEKQKSKERFNQIIIGLILVFLMVLSTMGYSLMSKSSNDKSQEKVIRIVAGIINPENFRLPRLRESPFYTAVHEYIFDDTNSNTLLSGKVIFDDGIAKKILTNFQDNRHCSALLVHCLVGQSRSPAVAIALNEVFNLGHDPQRMMADYPFFNQEVYKKMLEQAEKLRID